METESLDVKIQALKTAAVDLSAIANQKNVTAIIAAAFDIIIDVVAKKQFVNWIDVKNKLPKNDDIVLVWDKDAVELGFYREETWRDFSTILRHVTHWMHLPQKPNII